MDAIVAAAESKMQKSIEALENSLSQVRTGRAHPSILKGVKVSYYGNDTPLSQVSNIIIEDAQTLAVNPWEKSLAAEIDKAIRAAGLGLNPVMVSDSIKVPLPPLTEERRKELVKSVKQDIENSKVAVRNIRRDANSEIKELLKKKEISEDEQKQIETKVQVATDKFIKIIESMLANKEQELMQI